MEHHKGILRFPNSPISREAGEEINVGCEKKNAGMMGKLSREDF